MRRSTGLVQAAMETACWGRCLPLSPRSAQRRGRHAHRSWPFPHLLCGLYVINQGGACVSTSHTSALQPQACRRERCHQPCQTRSRSSELRRCAAHTSCQPRPRSALLLLLGLQPALGGHIVGGAWVAAVNLLQHLRMGQANTGGHEGRGGLCLDRTQARCMFCGMVMWHAQAAHNFAAAMATIPPGTCWRAAPPLVACTACDSCRHRSEQAGTAVGWRATIAVQVERNANLQD